MNSNKVLHRALAYSYILGKLQLENLETAVHEMGVIKDPDVGKLRDKLDKVTSANRNAFRIMERNIDLDKLDSLRGDMEELFEVIWEGEDG